MKKIIDIQTGRYDEPQDVEELKELIKTNIIEDNPGDGCYLLCIDYIDTYNDLSEVLEDNGQPIVFIQVKNKEVYLAQEKMIDEFTLEKMSWTDMFIGPASKRRVMRNSIPAKRFNVFRHGDVRSIRNLVQACKQIPKNYEFVYEPMSISMQNFMLDPIHHDLIKL